MREEKSLFEWLQKKHILKKVAQHAIMMILKLEARTLTRRKLFCRYKSNLFTKPRNTFFFADNQILVEKNFLNELRILYSVFFLRCTRKTILRYHTVLYKFLLQLVHKV